MSLSGVQHCFGFVMSQITYYHFGHCDYDYLGMGLYLCCTCTDIGQDVVYFNIQNMQVHSSEVHRRGAVVDWLEWLGYDAESL